MFKVDLMHDYMDFSSASEDDQDYNDCEDGESSELTTDGSHSQKASPTKMKTPTKQGFLLARKYQKSDNFATEDQGPRVNLV